MGRIMITKDRVTPAFSSPFSPPLVKGNLFCQLFPAVEWLTIYHVYLAQSRSINML